MNEIGASQREVGELSAHVENLREDLHEMRADLKAIRSVIDQGRGSVRVLLAGAGVVGAVSSALMTFGLKAIGK